MAVTLSIIVPVYNVSNYLNECLDSILAQTFTDFELILVDDGSTDNSGAICDEYAERDGRIRVIHKENNGVVSARKAGLSTASGKYAGYVDGDDSIDPTMYEQMIYYMQKYDCDIVMCDVIHEDKTLPLSSGSTQRDIEGGYYDKNALCEKLFPKMIYSGEFFKFGIYPVIWNKLFKREKLLEYQLAVDENIHTGEDVACVYPYLCSCDSLYFIKNKSLYRYRYSQTQMTKRYNVKFWERFKSLYNFLKDTDLARSEYGGQLNYYYAYFTKTAIGNELKKENDIPFRQKLRNIKEISSFAIDEGFIDKISITAPVHRLYFFLLKKNIPILIATGVSITRFIQKISR